MKSLTRELRIITATAVTILSVSASVLFQPTPTVFAQQPPTMGHGMPGNNQMPDMMQQKHQQMMQIQGQQTGEPDVGIPTMPGQDAFGAIQEIVRILETDPKTDWSKVNLEALRQHLIDMSEVTLKADAVTKPIDGGIQVTVTGTGRTVDAIQRLSWLCVHPQRRSDRRAVRRLWIVSRNFPFRGQSAGHGFRT